MILLSGLHDAHSAPARAHIATARTVRPMNPAGPLQRFVRRHEQSHDKRTVPQCRQMNL
jgi:hypothetical protein